MREGEVEWSVEGASLESSDLGRGVYVDWIEAGECSLDEASGQDILFIPHGLKPISKVSC